MENIIIAGSVADGQQPNSSSIEQEQQTREKVYITSTCLFGANDSITLSL